MFEVEQLFANWEREKRIPACQHLAITVKMWLKHCPWILKTALSVNGASDSRREKTQVAGFLQKRGLWWVDMMTNWKSNCGHVLWIGSDEQNTQEDARGRDEWTGGERWDRWDHRRNVSEWSSKVPDGDVRRFPGLPFTWSEYAWCTHKQVCSRVFVEERKEKKRKCVGEKEKSLGYMGGAQWRRGPDGPNHLHLSHPSVTPDTQQNYVLLFCSSWIKAVKGEKRNKH